MFRGLMTFVTALAVFWHTVAGCCAHHSHSEHSCDAACKAVSLANDGDTEGSGSCCQHSHIHSNLLCTSDSSGQQLIEDSRSTPCPGDSPTGCTEDTCVFAAPDSSGPSSIGQLGWDGSLLSYALVDSAVLLYVSCSSELYDSVTPPPLGGLRLHLAHSVLTL